MTVNVVLRAGLSCVLMMASLLLSSCAQDSWPSAGKVIGGHRVVADSPALTSAVVLVKRESDEPFCSGTLVASNLIVTAAHCVATLQASEFEVGFGEFANTTDSHPAGIERVAVDSFATYKPEGAAHFPNFDIAWVKIASPAPAGARPVEVLRDIGRLTAGDRVTIAGFGLNQEGCNAEVDESCHGAKLETESFFRDSLNRGRLFSLFRLGPKPGASSCYGDSGGPTYARLDGRWYLIGVTNGISEALTPEALIGGELKCGAGSQIYTFVGDYVPWIAASSGVKADFDDVVNPPAAPRVIAESSSRKKTFAEWLIYDNHNDPAWSSMQQIIEQTIAAQADFRKIDFAPVMLEPERVAGLPVKQRGFVFRDRHPLRVVSDLAPLASMDWVERIELWKDKICNFTPLARLPALTELKIVSNDSSACAGVMLPIAWKGRSDYARLQKIVVQYSPGSIVLPDGNGPVIPDLQVLNLGGLQLTDDDLKTVAWSRLANLQELVIADTEFGMINSIDLASLQVLRSLRLDDNQISSLAGLTSSSLERLEVSNWLDQGKLESIAGMGSLPKLRSLILSTQNLVDVSPLVQYPSLEELFIYDNFITDISSLQTLTKLTVLDASYNRLTSSVCPVEPAEICELEPQKSFDQASDVLQP